MEEFLKAENGIEPDGSFSCNIGEIDLCKALNPSEIGYDAKFQGQASSEIKDDQGQIVIQKGLNWQPFLDKGVFKDAHPFTVDIFDIDKNGNPKIGEDGKPVVINKSLPYMPKTIAVPIDEKAWYDPDV